VNSRRNIEFSQYQSLPCRERHGDINVVVADTSLFLRPFVNVYTMSLMSQILPYGHLPGAHFTKIIYLIKILSVTSLSRFSCTTLSSALIVYKYHQVLDKDDPITRDVYIISSPPPYQRIFYATSHGLVLQLLMSSFNVN
jgi:hypothetical protein